MKSLSILNDVLGPVMRGPSSSHTAGSYHIGRLARYLFGAEPAGAVIRFDPGGSYARVYRDQGSDLGFAAGLMGWEITDARFPQALEAARERGLPIRFVVDPLERADHPNTVEMELWGADRPSLRLVARSVGGGAVEIVTLGEWSLCLAGNAFERLVEVEPWAADAIQGLLEADALKDPERQEKEGRVLIRVPAARPLSEGEERMLLAHLGVHGVWTAPPLGWVVRGRPLFSGAHEMLAYVRQQGVSLGEAAAAYEAALLGVAEEDVYAEMDRRLGIMEAAVERGLGEGLEMQLLVPTAGKILRAEAAGKLALGGLHTRAGARAMAVMHVSSSMGVICAAPTAGAAGVLPGVLVTLIEEQQLERREAVRALLAAGAVGLVVGGQATFAAEEAGCQVEIGAAGAMAAAAVVEAAGGTAEQAFDAAAIALQNAMGSVCDPVQGIVEIPCHTRNAAAAASAFVCADLILGGYENPVPLDETVEAVRAVGCLLPVELRCTALGGLAQAPSAQRLRRRRRIQAGA
ncbi:MAG: L-serine ammonia-lyase, iron-sulfur-dependent, subunit alpha [Chloroflexia bacterium]